MLVISLESFPIRVIMNEFDNVSSTKIRDKETPTYLRKREQYINDYGKENLREEDTGKFSGTSK